MQKTSIVIPAHNEETSIGGLLKDTLVLLGKNSQYEILVVDDGSTDRTAGVAKSCGVKVISTGRNLGYGAALKRGIQCARNDRILIIDADGSYSPDDIPKLLRESSSRGMVVGDRSIKNVRSQFLRNIYKFFLNKLAGFLTASKIEDVNSGIRVFDRRILMRYKNLLCDGFSFSTSSTMIYLNAGLPVKFVGVSYIERKGKSKIRLKDGINFFVIVLRTACFFRPLRVFFAPGFALFSFGFLMMMGKLIFLRDAGEADSIFMVGGLMLGSLGLIADMIRLKG